MDTDAMKVADLLVPIVSVRHQRPKLWTVHLSRIGPLARWLAHSRNKSFSACLRWYDAAARIYIVCMRVCVCVARIIKVRYFSIYACHPCAGAMLIFSVSFQFLRMTTEVVPTHPRTRAPIAACIGRAFQNQKPLPSSPTCPLPRPHCTALAPRGHALCWLLPCDTRGGWRLLAPG
jgi:hypothetical protein